MIAASTIARHATSARVGTLFFMPCGPVVRPDCLCLFPAPARARRRRRLSGYRFRRRTAACGRSLPSVVAAFPAPRARDPAGYGALSLQVTSVLFLHHVHGVDLHLHGAAENIDRDR